MLQLYSHIGYIGQIAAGHTGTAHTTPFLDTTHYLYLCKCVQLKGHPATLQEEVFHSVTAGTNHTQSLSKPVIVSYSYD